MTNPVSNRDIYNALDRVRVEAKADMQRLENKLDNALRDIETLKIREATLSTKVAAIATGVSLVASIALYVLAYKLFGYPGGH